MTKITQRQRDDYLASLDRLRKEFEEEKIKKNIGYANGDLKENAEYEQACSNLHRIGNNIAEIEEILANSEIVKETTNQNKVGIGSIVRIRIENTDIPGLSSPEGLEFEITPSLGRIYLDNSKINELSAQQPVGKLLFGKQWLGKEEVFYYSDRDNKERVLHLLEVRI